mmetsp:Transcript_10660/g.12134  ORF Transcript_10660/g.12134 Transcript_10660/m.12134 type:complete len:219 (-) Transcript_10660:510-1166(-)
MFYPFFFLCYLTRGLRLVLLFNRAEKGFYFTENIMDTEDNDKTIAILKQSENFSSSCLNTSNVQKPTHPNIFMRIYYWFLFRFETESEYFVLTLLFTLVPMTLAIVFISTSNFRQLPLINYSHCLRFEDENLVFSSVLIDIILRCFDCFIIANVLILLMPICKDFNIIKEVRLIFIVLALSGILRNLLQIFMNDGGGNEVHYIDQSLFYLQTFTFIIS